MRIHRIAVLAAVLIGAAGVRADAWRRANLPFESVYGVAAHPSVRGLAFAATSSGTWRTSDAGAHWQRVTDTPLTEFAFNPFRVREVCALADGRAPNWNTSSCSADSGLTWSAQFAAFNFFLFDRRVPDRVYSGVGYGNAWLAVSDDHGKTWSVNGFTAGHPNYHGWGATDAGSNVYVTSWPHGGPSYFYWPQPIYRSRDLGKTWDYVIGDPIVWIVATDLSQHSTLYAAFVDVSQLDYTLEASTDAGTTWETRAHLITPAAVLEPIVSLAVDPVASVIVFAGGTAGMVRKSLDGGRTWSRIDEDHIHESTKSDVFTDRVHTISVGADGIVYAATRNALFSTETVGRRRSVTRR